MKIQFKDYTPRTNGKRTIDEAISELQREMDVRKRIYDRWLNEGRHSWVDAHDRFERLLTALRLLIQYAQEIESADAEHINPTSTPLSFDAQNALDDAPTEQAA